MMSLGWRLQADSGCKQPYRARSQQMPLLAEHAILREIAFRFTADRPDAVMIT